MKKIYPIFYKIKRNNKIIDLDIYISKRYFSSFVKIEIESIHYSCKKECFGGILTDKEYSQVVKIAKAEDFDEIEKIYIELENLYLEIQNDVNT